MNTLSNDELVEKIKELRGEEKRVLSLLLEYLHELDNRKFYRELGYSSLFTFCTQALGYSEGAAYRRISAARALSVCPELCKEIETGKLSLCTAAEVAKVLTVENKEQVLAAGAGKSNRAVKEALLPFQRESLPAKRAETVRVKRVAAGASPLIVQGTKRFSVTLELDEGEMALLEEAQRLLSARKLKDTVLAAAKQVIARDKRLSTLREKRVQKSLSTSKVESGDSAGGDLNGTVKRSRYISADVRHIVKKRDGSRCSYISAGGIRCCETRNLEYDHVLPFALGGKNTAENLRLVCRAHNQLFAEQVFGREVIQNIICARE